MSNVLFVCSRNKRRSLTAETIFRNSSDHNVRSAGTEPSARIRVTSKLILWADLIFVMEKRHKQRLRDNFPAETSEREIVILDIPDEYEYMDEELIETINTSVSSYLEK